MVEYVRNALENLDLIHTWYHICDGVALLKAMQGCPRQHQHADFSARRCGDPLFKRVTPFDDSGPYLDFEITSASTLTATVTKCNDCDSDDAANTPPGTVLALQESLTDPTTAKPDPP